MAYSALSTIEIPLSRYYRLKKIEKAYLNMMGDAFDDNCDSGAEAVCGAEAPASLECDDCPEAMVGELLGGSLLWMANKVRGLIRRVKP